MFYRTIEIGYREITGKRRNNGFGNTTEILHHIAGHADLAIGKKSSMPDGFLSSTEQRVRFIVRVSAEKGTWGAHSHQQVEMVIILLFSSQLTSLKFLDPFSQLSILFFSNVSEDTRDPRRTFEDRKYTQVTSHRAARNPESEMS